MVFHSAGQQFLPTPAPSVRRVPMPDNSVSGPCRVKTSHWPAAPIQALAEPTRRFGQDATGAPSDELELHKPGELG
jgi:hypothetical protein